ncbi:MAG: hypothetical protein COB73_05050 [Flavobacteriaceae bacterium]|nr:MAG: hypothetical protein COB73_05050 [Flavobacteriaceae bacterium]
MNSKNTNNNAFLIHISAFAGYFFPMGGIIAPVIFWQVKKDESEYLDAQGKEAVNFNLSFALYAFILGLSIIPLILGVPSFFGIFGGISLLVILEIIRFVLIILAAVKANNGEFYNYPLTIKFIK